MPRGKILSTDEKIKIKAYKDVGLSKRVIAKKLNRFHHLINNFMKLGEQNYDKNQFKGGNKKLTRRDLLLIFRTASSSNATAGQIQSTLNLPVTICITDFKSRHPI